MATASRYSSSLPPRSAASCRCPIIAVLSQGSDPQAIQPYFQACFDSVDFVTFDEKEKKNIKKVAKIKSISSIERSYAVAATATALAQSGAETRSARSSLTWSLNWSRRGPK